jgi:prophage regulatory protein
MQQELRDRPDRTLSFKRVRELTDLSRTTVWRLQRTGGFPMPMKISPGRVGWLEADILAWQRSRAATPQHKPFREPLTRPARTKSVPTIAATTPSAPATQVEPGQEASPPPRLAAAPHKRASKADPPQLGFAF